MKFLQRLMILSAWALVAGIVGAIGAGQFGLIKVSASYDTARTLAEHPGVIVLALMLICSPLQKITRKNWLNVRKQLGIVFGLLAISNALIFYNTNSRFSTLDGFVAAAVLAAAISLPLLLSSSNKVKKALGKSRSMRLHRTSHLLPPLIIAHMVLNPSVPVGISFTILLFALGFRFVINHPTLLHNQSQVQMTARI